MTQEALNLLRDLITIIGFIITVIAAIHQFLSQHPVGPPPTATGADLLTAILIIGPMGAILHGIAWHTLETMFGWEYGAGGGTSMPSGHQAVLLSLTLTIPLIILPPLYQYASGKKVISKAHPKASIAIVLGGAIGHIIMYGTQTPLVPGLKELIYPVNNKEVSLLRAVFAELVYGIVYFTLIVLSYQAVVHGGFRSVRIWI